MPVAALHDDLLHSIFLYTLPSTIIDNPGNVQLISPLNLSLVCRSWRRLVLSSPSLWSSLHVEMDETHDQYVKSEILGGLVEYWLRRSSKSPLSIHYTGAFMRDHAVPRVLNLLVREKYRWKCILIKLHRLHLRTAFNDDVGRSIKPFVLDCNSESSLSSLELDFPGFEDSFASVDLSNSTVGKSSLLEVLKLQRGTNLILPQQVGNLDLPHLRHLARFLNSPRALKEMRHLLTGCRNLESLRLRTLTMKISESFNDGQIITLPRLAEITFQSLIAATDTCRLLLGILYCPSLLSLRVNAGYWFEGLSSLQLYADFLLLGSHTNIPRRIQQHLKLPLVELMLTENYVNGSTAPQQVQVDTSAFIHLFRHLDSLERLHVKTHDATALFRLLSIPESQEGSQASGDFGDDILCPLLSEIVLQSSSDFDDDGSSGILEEAAKMVVSRWRTKERSLRKVSIRFTGQIAVLWSACMQEDARIVACVEEGLVLGYGRLSGM